MTAASIELLKYHLFYWPREGAITIKAISGKGASRSSDFFATRPKQGSVHGSVGCAVGKKDAQKRRVQSLLLIIC